MGKNKKANGELQRVQEAGLIKPQKHKEANATIKSQAQKFAHNSSTNENITYAEKFKPHNKIYRNQPVKVQDCEQRKTSSKHSIDRQNSVKNTSTSSTITVKSLTGVVKSDNRKKAKAMTKFQAQKLIKSVGLIDSSLKDTNSPTDVNIVYVGKFKKLDNINKNQPVKVKNTEQIKTSSKHSINDQNSVENTSTSYGLIPDKSQTCSDSCQNAAKKRGRRPKKVNASLPKDEIERKKILANIIHKKEAVSSNWKNFVKKQMHVQSERDPEIKKVTYIGAFRKNRKNLAMLAAIKGTNTADSLIEKPSETVHSNISTNTAQVSIVKSCDTVHSNISTNNDSNSYAGKKLTRYIGIDCEMVGVDDDGKDNMLARVSLVNKFGDCIYDKFVQPKEDVIDYRTHVSGVRPADLDDAESFEVVQREVAEIIHNRILVGHALRNDLKVLYLSHPKKKIRDTSKYSKFRQINDGRTPSLKKLTAKVLGVTIQEGEHNSIIDARAAIQLYMMYRKEWEEDIKNKKGKVRGTSKYRSQWKSKRK